MQIAEPKNYTDEQLLALFRKEGQADRAFALITKQYSERLYHHIRKMVIVHDDADDVLQNTLVKAWKGLRNFRSDAKLYTWLYRIATNESLTFLNSKKKRFIMPFLNTNDPLENKLKADEYFCGSEIELKLQKAILKLPEKQRVVFNLKYFEEMKYEEMSEVLDTSVGALKASYHHAVKKIEQYVKNN